jgi:hypothetical protein
MSGFITDAIAELNAIEAAVAEGWAIRDPEDLLAFRARVAHVVQLVASRRLMRDLEDIETAIYRSIDND